MCGILGGFNIELADSVIKKAMEKMRHRGPDAAFVSHLSPHFLASTRLEIVGGAEVAFPFSIKKDDLHVIANGEVYNWRELRTELLACGHNFHTECDIEVLPAAWKEWGCGMFNRLRGMFAIAILDKGRLILARDACGQKPLYYVKHHRGVLFCSEIKPLRALGVSLTCNEALIGQYMSLRYVPHPETLFNEVKQVKAGHFLEFSSSDEKEVSWWTAPSLNNPVIGNKQQKSAKRWIETIGGHLDTTVQQSLSPDKINMVYLSSGIDSSLLLESAVRSGADVETLTASFDGVINENNFAQSLAKKMGVKHHNIVLAEDSFADLERVVGQMELPIGDPIQLAFDALAKKTTQLGYRVALGGEGPDEVFLGYSFQLLAYYIEKCPTFILKLIGRFFQTPFCYRLERFTGMPTKIGRLGMNKVKNYFLDYNSSLNNWEKGVFLRTLFTPSETNVLLKNVEYYYPEFKQRLGLLDSHYSYQFHEWLPDWSIIRQERNAMAHSVEYRMPFLDHEFLSHCAMVPQKLKIKRGQTKWIWRELAKKRLGNEVGGIPKIPFFMPLSSFSQTKLFKDWCGDYLSDRRIAEQGILCVEEVNRLKSQLESTEFLSVKKVMSLIIFQMWYEQFIA